MTYKDDPKTSNNKSFPREIRFEEKEKPKADTPNLVDFRGSLNKVQDKKRGLGFKQLDDERDASFPLQAGRVRKPFKISKYYNVSDVLDQGKSDMCVGYAWAQFIAASPKMSPLPSPSKIYELAQRLDEFDGEEPEMSGTSLRGGAKACRQLGLINTNFSWAYDSMTVWNFLRSRGTVLLGTPWYSGMDKPNSEGVVTASGEDLGGHAYLVYGVSVEKKAFLCMNSWGKSWGMEGKFWLPIPELDELFRKGARACSAIEV
jgi:hypothetical protein